MSPLFVASSAAALLIALVNLVLAGHALLAARMGRERFFFALGPAGIGVFALAWFVTLLDPSTFERLRVLSGYGAVLALIGFVQNANAALDRSRKVVLSAIGVVVAAIAVGAMAWVSTRSPLLPVRLLFPRALCAPLLVTLTLAAFSARSHPERQIAALSRSTVVAVAVALAVYGGFTVAHLLGGVDAFIDPALCALLVAQVLTLLYVKQRRVEAHILVSRVVTYALLSGAVAFVTAMAFHRLGYPVDPVQVTVTVSVALFSSVLFLGVSERLNRGVERLLFPDQSRLSEQLTGSRAESAALRRRLERVERLAIAGELAAGVAHEIRNPLAALRGYAQLLEGQLPPDAQPNALKAVAIIREESDRIDRRVSELLTLARSNQRGSFDRTLRLHQVVMDAVAVAEGEPGMPPIRVTLEAAEDEVVGDPDEIRGAILNLLRNAAEACASVRNARVSVTTSTVGSEVVLDVIDCGVGLTPSESERAFEAFYTTKEGGTGLGLAIVRSAVEIAGGRVSLRPSSSGRGAHAQVALRRAARDAPPAERKRLEVLS